MKSKTAADAGCACASSYAIHGISENPERSGTRRQRKEGSSQETEKSYGEEYGIERWRGFAECFHSCCRLLFSKLAKVAKSMRERFSRRLQCCTAHGMDEFSKKLLETVRLQELMVFKNPWRKIPEATPVVQTTDSWSCVFQRT
ncbi:hypothetical protein [Polaromonas sp. CG_23.6]|uniref:hypothetical protein n=1 Tax=Polaromonas sp. CG_23.6 TaxID=2760709 RepID=UPI00247520A7|nr:hypothetical protein [Polaromonas sp. CG_23.6]MDH6186939.1 hypothetical protein [Polaromonas sp. CG_23.6]